MKSNIIVQLLLFFSWSQQSCKWFYSSFILTSRLWRYNTTSRWFILPNNWCKSFHLKDLHVHSIRFSSNWVLFHFGQPWAIAIGEYTQSNLPMCKITECTNKMKDSLNQNNAPQLLNQFRFTHSILDWIVVFILIEYSF